VPVPKNDAIREFYERGGYVKPKKPQQTALDAWASQNNMADGGVPALITSPKRFKATLDSIRGWLGTKQAERLEKAADLGADVSLYSPRGLAKAMDPDKGHLLTVMDPARFQDYALKIPEHLLGSQPYRFAQSDMPDLHSLLDYYQRIGERKGWKDVPELGIGTRALSYDPTLQQWGMPTGSREGAFGVPNAAPPVKFHEGRHRQMALENRGDPASLVSIQPATGDFLRDAPNQLKGQTFDEWLKSYQGKVIPEENLTNPRGFTNVGDLPVLGPFFGGGGQVPGYATGGVEGWRGMRRYVQSFKDIFKRPITVGADEPVLEQIAKDRRFKSQFETGTTHGFYDPEERAATEHALWGIDEDIDPRLRPIYGHVTDRNYPHMARQYGDWGAVLDPKVNRRSSFFLGDTLSAPGESSVGPYEFNAPWRYDRGRMKDFLKENAAYDNYQWLDNPATASGLVKSGAVDAPYIEAQVHEGLPWSDVRALVNKRGIPRLGDSTYRLTEDLQRMADKFGLPTYGYNKLDTGDPERWFRSMPGGHSSLMIPLEALSDIGYAEGGQVKMRPLLMWAANFPDWGKL